jgi:hypothetical protein
MLLQSQNTNLRPISITNKGIKIKEYADTNIECLAWAFAIVTARRIGVYMADAARVGTANIQLLDQLPISLESIVYPVTHILQNKIKVPGTSSRRCLRYFTDTKRNEHVGHKATMGIQVILVVLKYGSDDYDLHHPLQPRTKSDKVLVARGYIPERGCY